MRKKERLRSVYLACGDVQRGSRRIAWTLTCIIGGWTVRNIRHWLRFGMVRRWATLWMQDSQTRRFPRDGGRNACANGLGPGLSWDGSAHQISKRWRRTKADDERK